MCLLFPCIVSKIWDILIEKSTRKVGNNKAMVNFNILFIV